MVETQKDAGEELLLLSQQIIQETDVLILRFQNLTGELSDWEDQYYIGQFDRIQKLFDRFSRELRDAGFPVSIQQIREDLSRRYNTFYQIRTDFFNQYAERERTPPADAPKISDDAREPDKPEQAEGIQEQEISDDPFHCKRKKRIVRKPTPQSQQLQWMREAAAYYGISAQPDQPVTEADIRRAQLRNESEHQRQQAASDFARQERERLLAHNRRMEESARFEHLDSSHIDMSREGIGHGPFEPDKSQNSEAAQAAAATAAAAEKAARDERYREWLRQRQSSDHFPSGTGPGGVQPGETLSRTPPDRQQRFHLARITQNLGVVSYVTFSAAARKAEQGASKESDVVSAMFTAGYYVPTAVGMARAAVGRPTDSLEKGARRVTGEELGGQSRDTLRRYKALQSRIASLQEELSSMSSPEAPGKSIHNHRRQEVQHQLDILQGQLHTMEREAVRARDVRRFLYEKELDKDLLDALREKGQKGKLPKGNQPLREACRDVLSEETKGFHKRFGTQSQLTAQEIRSRINRLSTEGKSVKEQIRNLQRKGGSLSTEERQLLMKLKSGSRNIGGSMAELKNLQRARADFAYKERRLRGIMKEAGKRSMYKLSGMRMARSFLLKPLYAGQDSSTDGLAYIIQTVLDPTNRRLAGGTVKLPLKITGKIVRRVAPGSYDDAAQLGRSVRKGIYHIITAPGRIARCAVNRAGQGITHAVPIGIRTAAATPVRYLHRKYDNVLTGVLNFRKWFADTHMGRGITGLQMLGRKVSALFRVAGALLKKTAISIIGIFLALVLLIQCVGGILGVVASLSSSVIMSPEASANGKISLAPYTQMLQMPLSRFNYSLTRMVRKYEDNPDCENVTTSYAGSLNNTRELLSMMAVRFRQNIDPTSNPEIERYLNDLFDKSHIITATEHKYKCTGCKSRKRIGLTIDPETGFATIGPVTEWYCPGHMDVTLTVSVVGFDELFSRDTYTSAAYAFDGWTEENRQWVRMIYNQDWGELYDGLEYVQQTPAGAMVTSADESRIWNYLLNLTGNEYGAAGMMGNLYAESMLVSSNMENQYEAILGMNDASYTSAVDSGAYGSFTTDSVGYGLAQWTDTPRKESLLELAQTAGKSVGDLSVQFGLLQQELTGSYSHVLNALQNATSVREASDYVLCRFENPHDQSAAVKRTRADFGEFFYNKYVYGISAEGHLTQAQMRVIHVAMNSADYGIVPRAGYCQRWAAQVYSAVGYGLDTSASARASGIRYGVSSDFSIIPPGAAIYGGYNSQYGHVGIYVGNGLVYHNIGYVAVDSLKTWIQAYGAFCWGWEAGSDLTEME